MSLRHEGKVILVGYEPSDTGKTFNTYALVKVKLTNTHKQEVAEEKLKYLQKNLLKKNVTIFAGGKKRK